MTKDNSGLTKGLLIGFLAGSVTGAIVALLYAPKSGRELRADIKKKTDEVKEDVGEYMRATGAKAADAMNRGKHRSEELVASAREKAEHIMDDAERVLSDIKSRATSEQGRMRTAVKAGIDAYKTEKERGA